MLVKFRFHPELFCLSYMILAPLYLGIILLTVVVIFYIERKLPAIIQDRLGPMETGPYGMFQAIADLLKMIQKGRYCSH